MDHNMDPDMDTVMGTDIDMDLDMDTDTDSDLNAETCLPSDCKIKPSMLQVFLNFIRKVAIIIISLDPDKMEISIFSS
jgi:hypothetical protein